LYILILPRFSGGGAERAMLNILLELYIKNKSVGIIVFEKRGPLLSMIPNGIPIYNLETINLRYSIFHLIRKINNLKPKLVISTFGYINVTLLIIRFLLPKKTNIWIREANLPSISLQNNKHPKLMRLFYRLLYKKADKVICTSKIMMNEMLYDFNVSNGILSILPNPVNVSRIRSLASPLKRFDNGGVCYVASGRLTYQKGFDRLLYWFSKIKNKKSTLIVLGDGEIKNKLINYAKKLNIINRVEFKGFCDNPWQWYAGADAFLLSSRWEGMPNSALEALACGTLVIATKESGGVEEIFELSDNYLNAISISNKDQQFIDFMNKVKTKDVKTVSDSLLPCKYKINNVISIVEDWLKNIN